MHFCLCHLSVVNGRSIICQEPLWAAMIFLMVAKYKWEITWKVIFFTEQEPGAQNINTKLWESKVEELEHGSLLPSFVPESQDSILSLRMRNMCFVGSLCFTATLAYGSEICFEYN